VSASRREIFTAHSVNVVTDRLIVTPVQWTKTLGPRLMANRNSGVTRTGLKEEPFELSDKTASMYIEANNLNLQLRNVGNINPGTSQCTVQELS